ncbi:MAG TPA: dihydroorotase [Bacteroidales bacterium]|nr:dihydroorotase [Bacteroidales bacterium]
MKTIIKNAYIVNEGKTFIGSVILENGFIKEIIKGKQENTKNDNAEVIDAEGKYLFPGVIDDQVHFREPGLTHKADLFSESKAAVAGGVTSFMEMPNTIPNAITIDLLEEKYLLAAEKSLANFSFYLGASNDNLDELKKLNPINNCGIKVFMGSSTGNMLVNDPNILQQIFSTNNLIAVHCEDDRIIKENLEKQKEIYGENIPFSAHPIIRNVEACYRSSSMAVAMALKMNTRLHLLHLSSAEEMNLLGNTFPLEKKKITAEVCVHHLWFSDKDYNEKGAFIKWNPAIKSENDRNALWQALLDDRLDVIATDHAPHALEEKTKGYLTAPSGGPLIQHSLVAMLEFYHQKKISLETIVHKMAHAPAICFRVHKRGFIRQGYHADLVLVDLNNPWKVDRSNILSKCKWSPFEGTTFNAQVTHTFVNGNLVYCNGLFNDSIKGKRILFEQD